MNRGPRPPPPPEDPLITYWKCNFATVANTIIYKLGTCNGLFRLEQREFAREMRDNGKPCRNDLFTNTAQVLAKMLQNWCVMRTLHFGAIFPVHHATPTGIWMLPLPPNVEPLLVQQDMLRPRDYERHHIFKTEHKLLDPIGASFGEFVMDVDLDSRQQCGKYNNDNKYDRTGICECLHDKRICDVCWALFMNPALHILHRLLRELLGFKAFFTVFSGRRGFHIWVLDKRAIMAPTIQRKAWIAALKTAWHDFGWIYELLAPIFDSHPVLRARYVPLTEGVSLLEQRRRAGDAHREAVMEALYPKLDEGVSTDATHLKKAPLAPHPVTGNICSVICDVNDDEVRFVPSVDVMHYTKVKQKNMQLSEFLILREIKKVV